MANKNILILLVFLIPVLITSAQQDFSDYQSLLSLRSRSFNSIVENNKKPYNVISGKLINSSFQREIEGITLFSGLGDNIVNTFKGDNLYLHLAGIASTAIIVSTNTDYYVHKYFNENETYGNFARPAVRFGTFFPFAVAGPLYAFGKINKNDEALAASFAVLQSTMLAFTYNSLLKALTGRPNPRWREEGDLKELSKEFRFGFSRGGIFWGWPSGHTSSTVAVISALTNFYPDKTWLKVAGYSYIAYMVFSVSSLNRGGMHWFSDAVAAVLMSYAIGSTVGKHFRSKFTREDQINTNQNIELFPLSLKYYF